MTGIERIAVERKRQIEEEGWTPDHDIQHYKGELAEAAAAYAYPEMVCIAELDKDAHFRCDILFPDGWAEKRWKPSPDDRIRELEKAGALIAAEIDRLQAQE